MPEIRGKMRFTRDSQAFLKTDIQRKNKNKTKKTF